MPGTADNSAHVSSSPSADAANAILYGQAERQRTEPSGHHILIDGFLYKSAIPRHAPAGNDVENTIKRLIMNWPNLAENRSEALHYLLCSIKMDFEWNDGQLVIMFDQDPGFPLRFQSTFPLLENTAELYHFLAVGIEDLEPGLAGNPTAAEKASLATALDEISSSYCVDKDELVAVLDDLSNLCLPCWEQQRLIEKAAAEADRNRRTRVYNEQLANTVLPLSGISGLGVHSALNCFPDDIDADWLAAIETEANLLKAAKIDDHALADVGDEAEKIRRHCFQITQDNADQVLTRVADLRNRRV